MTLSLKAMTLALVSTISFSTFASTAPVYITIGTDAVHSQEHSFGPGLNEVERYNGVSIVEIDESTLPWLSEHMHENFNRCGGFVLHESLDEAKDALNEIDGLHLLAKRSQLLDYSINSQNLVKPLINQISGERIFADIIKLSSFKNRHYRSPEGVEAAKWIKANWEKLTAARSDIHVELYNHAKWEQPSVIATIEGESDEIVIVGGHLDSIAGFWGGASAKAPGADDNASGIATITEVLKVLVDNSYKPQKTIQFIGYAAEEAGLLGSKEIAAQYRAEGKTVVGVMQLDMTGYKGTKDLDIVMMRDYTNDNQNQFIGALIDTYLPEIKWGYDKCGYACSDHASWHGQGFAASMPFEARKNDMSPSIHSARDTVESIGNNANHAQKFAKMALAYIVELDR